MITSKIEQHGLAQSINYKNQRLLSNMKRLHVMRYGDPETGQRPARGRPSQSQINLLGARATRLYNANKDSFQEQAVIDAGAEGVETDFSRD